MTVAARDNFGDASVGVKQPGPWRRLWQVPLLVGGIVVFGLGVRALVHTIRPVPFAVQVEGIRGLLAAEQFEKAIEQINIMGNYYNAPEQQGELQVLAGDAHFLAQQKEPALVRANYERVADHYRKAVAWGIVPTSGMNERWGEAAMAIGNAGMAMEKLEAAIAEDGTLVKPHARELVMAYMEAGKKEKALEIVDRMLAAPVADGAAEPNLEEIEDQTWALCKRIEIALKNGNPETLKESVTAAREALSDISLRDPAGRILGWIGRAEFEQGDIAGAEADLREARQRFAVHHLDDGRAAVLLGKVAEARGDWNGAAELFEAVVIGHAGTSIWAAARLGRAEVATQTQAIGPTDVADFGYAIGALKEIEGMDKPPVGGGAELISWDGLRVSLVGGYQRASDAGKLQDALLFLALQQQMGEKETPETAHRLATTKERRADELMAEAIQLDGQRRLEQEAGARRLYAAAAGDYQRYSALVTLDDAESGDSLWKAAELLDRAGETMPAAQVYERFAIQRPRDARVPEGLLMLGRLYESAGMVEKAIDAYARNTKENPKAPASYTSAVNLARCYMALAERTDKAPEKEQAFGKAEQALLSLVQDNMDLQPEAREFRESLLELGELYYRTERWADAILRLEEVVQRYPEEARGDHGVRALFILAESYRKSAEEIGQAIQKNPAIGGRQKLESARAERLLTAAGWFTRVIGLLDSDPAPNVPVVKLTSRQDLYLRTSFMDRASCYFNRGEYERAIKLYDEVAARFSESVDAVAAYVQIVNAYLALKQPAQASTAAERGRWILKRIPDEAFGRESMGVGRDYYEKLLALARV